MGHGRAPWLMRGEVPCSVNGMCRKRSPGCSIPDEISAHFLLKENRWWRGSRRTSRRARCGACRPPARGTSGRPRCGGAPRRPARGRRASSSACTPRAWPRPSPGRRWPIAAAASVPPDLAAHGRPVPADGPGDAAGTVPGSVHLGYHVALGGAKMCAVAHSPWLPTLAWTTNIVAIGSAPYPLSGAILLHSEC